MRTHTIIRGVVVILPLVLGCRDSGTGPHAQRQTSSISANAVASPDAGGAALFHVVNSGDLARLNASGGGNDGSTTNVTVMVNRTGTPSDLHTMLFYLVSRCDGSVGCVFVEGGSGEIPNGDLQGNGAVMTLATNTSAVSNPSFLRFRGNGGRITLEWRADGFSSTFSNGTSEVHFGNTSRSEHGESQTRSASLNGTLVGLALPLPDGTHDASIGTGQQEIVIRDR